MNGEQVVSVVCVCGLGSRNQLAPFHNHPRLSKMSASWGRGRRDRQAVNLRDAGVWAAGPGSQTAILACAVIGLSPARGEASMWEL